MAPHAALAMALLFSASLCSTCDGGKVLIFPLDGSHWLNMKVLVEALHSRGHQITVLRSTTSWYVAEASPHYDTINVGHGPAHLAESQTSMTSFLQRELEIRKSRGTPRAFLDFYRNIFHLMAESQKMVARLIRIIIEDKPLMKQLNETGYDLFLTDPCFPGGVILGHYLRLPMVLNARWIFDGDAHFAIAPSPMSYVPQLFSHYPDKMDFFQRFGNVVFNLIQFYMRHYVSSPPYQVLCDEYFGGDVSFMSLMQGADLWLMRVDFVLEFPRPFMPNVVHVGGFQGKPAAPLPADLEDFVQSSGEHGVIVMTMGTLLNDLGPELTEIVATAFARLPQKVVWRHNGARPLALGNNTRLLKWLPQNDLLGHPKTRLFVTHGGTNGIYEAIYHGVPLLGIPLIFDQHDNMVRLKARGVAEAVELTDVDVESLTGTLRDLLDPEKPYRRNMMRLSRLHHDQPMKPLDTAVFWMEFVMRHRGAAHLRTESYKLPWYAYHSLDVMAALGGVVLLVVGLVWVSCRFLLRCFLSAMKAPSKPKRE